MDLKFLVGSLIAVSSSVLIEVERIDTFTYLFLVVGLF